MVMNKEYIDGLTVVKGADGCGWNIVTRLGAVHLWGFVSELAASYYLRGLKKINGL